MMRAAVVVVCLASAGIIAVYTRYFSGGSGEPVYTVPARAPDPAPRAPASTAASRPVDRPIDPTDRTALARALQRELRRVGCYNGEITGVWTTSSRMAMKTFNERVNATLPVDTPDPVLLSLVQGHRERACGAEAEKTADVLPAAAGAAAAVSAGVAAAAPAAPQSKASAPGAPRPAAGGGPGGPGGLGGPAPPEGVVRESRPRRTAEAPPSRPPKIVRDVLKALGFK